MLAEGDKGGHNVLQTSLSLCLSLAPQLERVAAESTEQRQPVAAVPALYVSLTQKLKAVLQLKQGCL